ncbi:pyridoxamine 5'-phosphate oxidase family protein [Aeromicrobium sp.]|uniref:pyridoxamine 5'-phosphate oxidase family protein n=1 Tax=Aeromicrobium sp. TaxID=1871063 RepID=UPI002FC637C2
MPDPVQLSYWQCESILRAEVVGRIAFSAPDGPHIVPINYSVVDEAIIVRTSPDSLLAAHGCGVMVAFEVDYINHNLRRGCSVVARGETEVVTDPAMAAHINQVWEPRPWAGGTRPMLLRLRWSELSGRQLDLSWDPLSEVPLHRTESRPR